ncbi:MAG TPA: LEA type 2 family protein [Methanoregulaceae archaeon]|nr:LEA type 2 family protein [Methanoregulaceae archaeon]HRY75474.1 LEA type 2 family protein [Methanoregulaceae archaeon]
MPILRDPSITIEDVKIRGVTLSSLEFDVAIRVQNPNIVGVTLREFPFLVLVQGGDGEREIANGNTGNVRIRSRDTTLLTVPLTSRNAELIKALAALVAKGGIEVTIRGSAVVEAVITGWSVPVENSITVTLDQVKEALDGSCGENQSR